MARKAKGRCLKWARGRTRCMKRAKGRRRSPKQLSLLGYSRKNRKSRRIRRRSKRY